MGNEFFFATHIAVCIWTSGCQKDSLDKTVDVKDPWLEGVACAFESCVKLKHFYSIGIWGGGGRNGNHLH